MHASLCALVTLCAQTGLASSPESIDTFIYLIRPNLTKIWSPAYKNIAIMHASLHAQVELWAQTGLACYPYSIDTLISLI